MSNRAKELKPLLLKTSFLLLNFSLLFTLCGCLPILKDYTINEYGYFQYIIIGSNNTFRNEEDESIAIVGFTDFGLEQETLDIPREIDGCPVNYIGYRKPTTYSDLGYEVKCGEKLKKLYIFDNIKKISYFYNGEVELMLCSEKEYPVFKYFLIYKNAYLNKTLYESLEDSSGFKPANINFMNNYPSEDDGGLYRLDNIETDQNIPEPPDPTIEGYEFTGWYTEVECINQWDFEVVPTIEENEDFTLFAGWQPL